jgi:hypothetical protein
MAEEKERFLERWSRRKQEQAAEAPAPVEKKIEEEKKETPAAALPPVDQLKPDSDFKPFMDRRVDLGTRREALKKLFADAHFNVPDPFEPYSGDFTIEDPIPDEMLKTLGHARRVLFDEREQAGEEVAQQAQEKPKEEAAQQPLPEGKDVARKQDA